MLKTNHSPYIIAEVGSNWKSLGDLIESIKQAKKAGADAVKFQMFSWRELYGFPEDSERQRNLDKYQLPKAYFQTLHKASQEHDIDFMCTGFSFEGFQFINPFVKYHKIASSDSMDTGLIRAVLSMRKPVLISLGGKSLADAQSLAKHLEKHQDQVALLHCISQYPAAISEPHMIKLLRIATNDKFMLGFSDHSTDATTIPWLAVKHYGAQIIEKHFKITDMDTPDSGHSLNPHNFKIMVNKLKHDHDPDLLDEQKDMVYRHSKRLVAIKHIRRGEVLHYGQNYAAHRSLTDQPFAFPPYAPHMVEAKKAVIDLMPGTALTTELIE